MKNPNGYGTIAYLGANRRKPYAPKVSSVILDRETNTYKRVFKYIGYYATKKEALTALATYNLGNVPPETIGITFKEVWDIWERRYIDKGSDSRKRGYLSAIKKWAPIYPLRMDSIRLADLQDVIDCYEGSGKSTLSNMKIVANFVFEWAIKNDIIDKNYAEYIEIAPKGTVSHIPLTHSEFDRVVSLPTNENTAIMKICLYTGCRPSEVLELPAQNIHLSERYFNLTHAKTKAGIRVVPIAEKTVPCFEYLLTQNGNRLTDTSYWNYNEFFKQLLPTHTPHDTRTTFISYLQELAVPLPIIQKIVGHSSGNITTDIYTKLSLEPMLNAVNLL